MQYDPGIDFSFSSWYDSDNEPVNLMAQAIGLQLLTLSFREVSRPCTSVW